MRGGLRVEDQQQVFVYLSPDVQELFADNQTDLVELLQHEGVDVRRGFASDPTASVESGHKEPATIIIASAALVAALTPLLVRAIEALSHKTVVVTEQLAVPVEDSQGNVVRDTFDQPVLQWVDRTRILESSDKPRDETTVNIKGPLGISIEYKSSPKE